jgi:hypothetical protein
MRKDSSWLEARVGSQSNSDQPVPGTVGAQFLWLHMIGCLLPAITLLGDEEGLLRLDQDRNQLRERVVQYAARTASAVVAFCELAMWSRVPLTIDDVCNAVMLWCYWHAFDPRQGRDVSKTFDLFTPLSGKPSEQSKAQSGHGTGLAVWRQVGKTRLRERQWERIASGDWEAFDEL